MFRWNFPGGIFLGGIPLPPYIIYERIYKYVENDIDVFCSFEKFISEVTG